ncbi:MAG: hypothetical protein IPF94_05355 [Betaproteobacteria bacterium]|nr:hypothetical protein [Betaproteobacteria bacterium]
MAITQAIQRRGFRKWYERELLVGHSHLVLLLLSAVTLLGGMEAFTQPDGQRWLMGACVVVAAAIGLWALRRYLFLLTRAEHIANQAVCAQCQAYGRWAVEPRAGQPRAADGMASDDGEAARMQVCCRGCGFRWQIEW